METSAERYLEMNVDGSKVTVDLDEFEVVAENIEVQSRVNSILKECGITLAAL